MGAVSRVCLPDSSYLCTHHQALALHRHPAAIEVLLAPSAAEPAQRHPQSGRTTAVSPPSLAVCTSVTRPEWRTRSPAPGMTAFNVSEAERLGRSATRNDALTTPGAQAHGASPKLSQRARTAPASDSPRREKPGHDRSWWEVRCRPATSVRCQMPSVARRSNGTADVRLTCASRFCLRGGPQVSFVPRFDPLNAATRPVFMLYSSPS